MADTCVEMVFHYKGRFSEINDGKTEETTLTSLQGPASKIKRFTISESFGIFGVYFFPYSLPLLFGIQASDLVNQLPDLSTSLGQDGSMLEEQMMMAADTPERVKIMTAFLEKRLSKTTNQEHRVISIIQEVLTTKGNISIGRASESAFLSRRQFERKFKEFAGLPPKLFMRIVRFQAACNHFSNNIKSLTAIAHECGYYDQSHFIHDFKQFSGHCPRQFFSAEAEGTEWR